MLVCMGATERYLPSPITISLERDMAVSAYHRQSASCKRSGKSTGFPRLVYTPPQAPFQLLRPRALLELLHHFSHRNPPAVVYFMVSPQSLNIICTECSRPVIKIEDIHASCCGNHLESCCARFLTQISGELLCSLCWMVVIQEKRHCSGCMKPMVKIPIIWTGCSDDEASIAMDERRNVLHECVAD
jgi:hypothetical protein